MRNVTKTAAVAALAFACSAAFAGDWPTRAITLVVPFSPGGNIDFTARAISDLIGKSLGQPVIVENRPGAGGVVGAAYVARAKPDGYTLLLGNSGPNAVANAVSKKVPYDGVKSFTVIGGITTNPAVLTISTHIPASNFAQFNTYAKGRAGGANVGTAGNGSFTHLAIELVRAATATPITVIPYKGTGPAAADLMGHSLDAMAELGLDAARAVVVVDASASADDIAAMHRRGARGVRFNLLRPSPVAAAHMQAIARLIAPWGWHLQLHASADQIAALAPAIRDLPVQVVFDHLARLPGHGGCTHPAFDVVAELLQQQRAWLKLSGAELDGAAEAPGYASAVDVAQRFISLSPGRLVWGSNWPHPAIHKTGDAAPDDAALLRWLSACAPDSAVQRQILLDNACNLYGFSV